MQQKLYSYFLYYIYEFIFNLYLIINKIKYLYNLYKFFKLKLLRLNYFIFLD